MTIAKISLHFIFKGVDKGSAEVIWDREDNIKEVEKQLADDDVYVEVPNDPQHFISTIHQNNRKN